VPFEGQNLKDTLSRTLQCVVDFTISSAFDSISKQCRTMILWLLTKEAHDRPTAEEASQHLWLGRENLEPRSCRQRHTVTGGVRQNLEPLGGTVGTDGGVLPEAETATKLPGTLAKSSASCPTTPRQARPPWPGCASGSRGSTAPAESPLEDDSVARLSSEIPTTPKLPKIPMSPGSQAQKPSRLCLATGDSSLGSALGAAPADLRPATQRANRRRRTVHIVENSKQDEESQHSQSEKRTLPLHVVDLTDAQPPGPQVSFATFAPTIAPPTFRPRRFSVPAAAFSTCGASEAPHQHTFSAWSTSTKPRRFSRKISSGAGSASTRASSSNSTSTHMAAMARVMP